MYENISKKRKQELEILKTWADCAGDNYYFSMEQPKFDENMKNCKEEEFFKAYSRQRKIGLEEFANEMSNKIALICNSEELHYLLDGHNYDSGRWTVMQCLNNSCCDIRTARMVYWLMCPDYYYDQYVDLDHVPESDINIEDSKVLKFIEEKAISQGFKHNLTPEYEDEEAESHNEYADKIPDSLFVSED